MQIVFEMIDNNEARAYVVDVQKIDDSTLFGLFKGQMREFPLSEIRHATTVSGRPFSLRPFDARTMVVRS